MTRSLFSGVSHSLSVPIAPLLMKTGSSLKLPEQALQTFNPYFNNQTAAKAGGGLNNLNLGSDPDMDDLLEFDIPDMPDESQTKNIAMMMKKGTSKRSNAGGPATLLKPASKSISKKPNALAHLMQANKSSVSNNPAKIQLTNLTNNITGRVHMNIYPSINPMDSQDFRNDGDAGVFGSMNIKASIGQAFADMAKQFDK